MRLLKVITIILILLLVLGFLVFSVRSSILSGLASILVVDDPLQPADLIFVLTGDEDTRPFHAATLYKQGLAPRIAVAQSEVTPTTELGLYPNSTDVVVRVLQELGIPDRDITVVKSNGGATSTRDEARLLRRYLAEHDVRRVIIVTSPFHTRRANWIFKRELSDLEAETQMSAAPQQKFNETNWWQSERGLLAFTNEYIKLFYYYAVY